MVKHFSQRKFVVNVLVNFHFHCVLIPKFRELAAFTKLLGFPSWKNFAFFPFCVTVCSVRRILSSVEPFASSAAHCHQYIWLNEISNVAKSTTRQRRNAQIEGIATSSWRHKVCLFAEYLIHDDSEKLMLYSNSWKTMLVVAMWSNSIYSGNVSIRTSFEFVHGWARRIIDHEKMAVQVSLSHNDRELFLDWLFWRIQVAERTAFGGLSHDFDWVPK